MPKGVHKQKAHYIPQCRSNERRPVAVTIPSRIAPPALPTLPRGYYRVKTGRIKAGDKIIRRSGRQWESVNKLAVGRSSVTLYVAVARKKAS